MLKLESVILTVLAIAFAIVWIGLVSREPLQFIAMFGPFILVATTLVVILGILRRKEDAVVQTA
jgi:UDP-N-acetylmuramyl pentapeptide phosphotransferase/UDP-N-acetylglucosamine-1-phosphate transferase